MPVTAMLAETAPRVTRLSEPVVVKTMIMVVIITICMPVITRNCHKAPISRYANI